MAEVLDQPVELGQARGWGPVGRLVTHPQNGAHLDADQTFRTGLDFLLDGIEARISR